TGAGTFTVEDGKIVAAILANGLAGMNLEDISALQGLPLRTLALVGNPVSDLSPLEGAKLETISIGGTAVTDIAVLRSMPITHVNLGGAPVDDFAPLSGKRLTYFAANNANIADISFLVGMPLETLQLYDAESLGSVAELGSLRSLKRLMLPPHARKFEFLRDGQALASLNTVYEAIGTGQTAEQYWAKYDTYYKSIETVVAKLETANPAAKPLKVKIHPAAGLTVYDLDLRGNPELTDLSALKGQPIEHLDLSGKVRELTPIAGTVLRSLDLSECTHFADAELLKPLTKSTALKVVVLPDVLASSKPKVASIPTVTKAAALTDVPTEGLVGYWPLDDAATSTTAKDKSGNGFDVKILGRSRRARGMYGGAVEFDGIDDFVDLGNPETLNIDGDITMSAWIRTSNASRPHHSILSHGYTREPPGEVVLRLARGRDTFISSANGGSWAGPEKTSGTGIGLEDDVLLNNWLHLASVCEGTTWRLYINGLLAHEKQGRFGTVKVNANWAIGGKGRVDDSESSDRFFEGLIDEVRIYNRALSAEEVSRLVGKTEGGEPYAPEPVEEIPVAPEINAMPTDGLVAYWPMDEPPGAQSARDKSGNTALASVKGTPQFGTGLYGNAIEFDDVSDLLMVPNAPALESLSDATFSLWLYWRGVKNVMPDMTLLQSHTKVDRGQAFNSLLAVVGTGFKKGMWDGSKSAGDPLRNDALSSGAQQLKALQWTHCAIVRKGLGCSVLVNGSVVAEKEMAMPLHQGPGTTWSMGASPKGAGTWRGFPGLLDEVRIYDRALSVEEVKLLAKLPKAGPAKVPPKPGEILPAVPQLLATSNGGRVVAKLLRDNPVWDGTGQFSGGGGKVISAKLRGEHISSIRVLHDQPISHLDLGETRIADDALRHLRNMPVVNLQLASTDITDRGVAMLVDTTIQHLNLGGTRVTSECLDSIVKMNVVGLGLPGTRVTDVSALAKCTTLRGLSLPANAENVEALRSLPLHRIGYNDLIVPATQFWRREDELGELRALQRTKPLYISIDISSGPASTAYPVDALTAEPENLRTNNKWKTTHILLRRIPAGTFTMGTPAGETGRQPERIMETAHQVTLTKDYYAGIFEITKKQWQLIMGGESESEDDDALPHVGVSYLNIRGYTAGAGWPKNGYVDGNSFMGKLRMRSGISSFDLPTEAQWEYACRAGTTTAFSFGNTFEEMHKYANYREKSSGLPIETLAFSKTDMAHDDGYETTGPVGTYLPNDWGLYNMHGNVHEWCLDWITTDLGSEPATDPVGPEVAAGPRAGEHRVIRGGCW
ncbi:MAG: LamG-like jellyroll fold domain-containing protein, partial [Planctomycetota bacterium]